jgi:hypothetical protein
MWNYDFLTATYFILLFMKMQGRQPKIKSNMKKYSQFITYTSNQQQIPGANATTATSVGQVNNNTIATPQSQATANRILVEKQLASLTIGGSSAPPKIMTNGTASPVVKDASKPAVNSNARPPTAANAAKHNIENMQPQQPSTPHNKQQQQQTGGSAQKAKQVFIESNEKPPSASKQREARSKTKTTTPNSKGNSQQQAAMLPPQAKASVAVKRDEPSPDSSDAATSSSSSTTSSSESLSVSSNNASDSNNFVLPSRVNRATKK